MEIDLRDLADLSRITDFVMKAYSAAAPRIQSSIDDAKRGRRLKRKMKVLSKLFAEFKASTENAPAIRKYFSEVPHAEMAFACLVLLFGEDAGADLDKIFVDTILKGAAENGDEKAPQ